jgi:lysophospholipase L1-like esterase
MRAGRLIGPILLSVVALVAVEAGLRLAGFEAAISGGGAPRLNLLPLFRPATRSDGTAILQRRDAPVSFEERKAPNGMRVFVLGESSVIGFPFGTEFAFPAFLQQRLQQAFPDRRVEVVNCGVPGIASWQVRQIADEIAAYQPDVVIVYTGHNDWIIPGPEAVDPLSRHLSGLRLYQLAVVWNDALRRWWYGPIDEGRLRDKGEAFGSLRDRARGRSTLTKREREWTAARYADNLRAIVARAQSAGARVLLASLGQNLSDFPPGASRHRPGLSGAERDRWRAEVEAADRLRRAGDCPGALAHLDQALAIDARPALVQYARGKCLEALGRFDEARAAYVLASDLDEAPLGAPSQFNTILFAVARETGAEFVDVAGALDRRSEHGLVGSELFVDHVHPTVEGHFEIARALAAALGSADTGDRAPSPEAIAARRPDLKKVVHLANIVLYTTLGWYDTAFDEVPDADWTQEEALKTRQMLERLRAEDALPSWSQVPDAPD